jgi:predicted nucleic acid-binding protein
VTCVVDASVAFKWFLADEPNGEEALRLVQRGEILVAPDLLVAEVCNAAWRVLRSGRISRAQFDNIPSRLPRYFGEFVSMSALAARAAAIAVQLDHPVYDCFYIALAEGRQLPLVTADARLLARLARSSWTMNAVHLAQYQSAG